MTQLLTSAVAYLRERGAVHRDIKPQNILFHDDFSEKLTDFGFPAEPGANEPRLREVLGTRPYLALELVKVWSDENQPGYGHEVDMWGCGVVMFTMLSGSLPFRNRNEEQMLRSIMERTYEFKNRKWDDISETKNLVRRLLTVYPQERITARDALQHLFFRGKQSFNVRSH